MVSPIIAIDGYSSTGKSTYAKLLAKEFGWIHIDTGAMYRAVTLYAIENFMHVNRIDEFKFINNLHEISIEFRINSKTMENETYLNGQNIDSEIRSIEVTEFVSEVSKIPEVREFLVKQQREMANKEKVGVVLDGRDIGTVVFPDADIKFFITASLEERVRRRLMEYHSKNHEISREEVEENLKHRDYLDENREISPLKKADDAFLIDNTNLTQEETFQEMKKITKEKLKI